MVRGGKRTEDRLILKGSAVVQVRDALYKAINDFLDDIL